MLIRRETPTDVDAIHAVIAAAFARRERAAGVPVEVGLVERLRESEAWLPALSLVAVDDLEQVVGHVLCTRAWVDATAVLALGPLAVHPDRQRRGVGHALMHAVLGAADALGEPMIGLLGDPAYYRRFGFRPAAEYGVQAPRPEWSKHFQARGLTTATATLRGAFAYPEPFGRG